MSRFSSGPQTKSQRNTKKGSTKGTLFTIANNISGGKLGLLERVLRGMKTGSGGSSFSTLTKGKKKFGK